MKYFKMAITSQQGLTAIVLMVIAVAVAFTCNILIKNDVLSIAAVLIMSFFAYACAGRFVELVMLFSKEEESKKKP